MSEATVLSPDDDARRTGGVQSVERAFKILELLASSDGDMTLSAIGSASALPLPTIHRLVRTLVSLGYVAQTESRSYVLAPGLIRLGEVANRQIGAMARPELGRLVEALGETANLAILDSDMVMYAAQVPSGHSMRMFTEVGRRVNLHNTGVGKAILATFSEKRVRQIVDRQGLPQATEQSIRTLQDLLEDLQRIRERGYSIDDGEQEVGVRCFAVAIPSSPIPAAISVSGPNGRVDEEFGERAVPLLRAASARLSDLLATNSTSQK